MCTATCVRHFGDLCRSVGIARSRGGNGQGAGPSHKHYPHQHSHGGAKRTVPAGTGQEVSVRCPCPVELSDLCQVLWDCGVPPGIVSLPGSWAASVFPVGAAAPEERTGAQEDASCR